MLTEMPSWVPLDMASTIACEENEYSLQQFRETPLPQKGSLVTAHKERQICPKENAEELPQSCHTLLFPSSSKEKSRPVKLPEATRFVKVDKENVAPKMRFEALSKSFPPTAKALPKPCELPRLATPPKILSAEKEICKPQESPKECVKSLAAPAQKAPALSKEHVKETHSKTAFSKERLSEKEVVKTPLVLAQRKIEQLNTLVALKTDEREEPQKRSPKWLLPKVARCEKQLTYQAAEVARPHSYSYQGANERPLLEPPRIGVFSLYYLLTKIGILSDATSHWEAKEDIKLNQEEMEKARRARLEEMKKAIEKEESTRRWGLATKVFSWFTSFMAIFAGIALLITGIGVIAGGMLLTSGVISMTNHVLDITGGWQKIAEALPGDNMEKKRAIITWMQIGITLLCLILAGAATVFGGYKNIGEATQHFMTLFGSVVMIGHAVSTIGQGVTHYLYKNRLASTRDHTRRLAELKHQREDLMEKTELAISRMRQLFEDLSKILDFETELFQADQKLLTR